MVKFYVKMILPLVLILPGCVPPEPEPEVKPKTAVELRPLSDKVKGTSKSYFHFIAGYREELAGNLKEAESSYFQAVRNNPDSSFLATRLASLLVRQGKLAEAEKFALKATTQNAKNLEAHFVLGGIYASRTKLDKAVATYTELLKMSPNTRKRACSWAASTWIWASMPKPPRRWRSSSSRGEGPCSADIIWRKPMQA